MLFNCNPIKLAIQCHRIAQTSMSYILHYSVHVLYKMRLNHATEANMFCRRHMWSTYAVFLTTITSWALPRDTLLIVLWCNITSHFELNTKIIARVVMISWIVFFCRIVKYFVHFFRYPSDLVYAPLIPIFGYYHCVFIKAWAMVSTNVVSVHLE